MSLDEILAKSDELKRFPQGKPDQESIQSYKNALEIAREMCREDRLYKLEYDDPDEKLVYHSVIVGLKNEDFNGTREIKQFIDFLESFEEFSFFGKANGDIEMCLGRTLYT